MSEVKRYFTSGGLPSCQATRKLYPYATDYVRASDYDTAQSQLAALREELATSKRNEHNSEVAYKAAIEKQEELRAERNEFSLTASRLKVDNENYDRLLVRKSNQCDDVQKRLADAERRNAELLKAVEQSIEWFETMSSADGSGHADLARAIRRIAALNPNPEAASHD